MFQSTWNFEFKLILNLARSKLRSRSSIEYFSHECAERGTYVPMRVFVASVTRFGNFLPLWHKKLGYKDRFNVSVTRWL